MSSEAEAIAASNREIREAGHAPSTPKRKLMEAITQDTMIEKEVNIIYLFVSVELLDLVKDILFLYIVDISVFPVETILSHFSNYIIFCI